MGLCSEYDRFAEYYDYVGPYRNRGDIPFYIDLAGACGGPVLEVGCGTGRVLIPCARAGAEIVGLDLSPGMIEICRAKLAAEPPEVQGRVELVTGDMRAFDLGRRFDLIAFPFRSFQHLETVGEQRATLAACVRHLAPGGRLVLDLYNPSLPLLGDPRWLRAPLVEPPIHMPDGRVVVRSLRIAATDYLAQTQDVEIAHEVTWPDGRVDRHAEVTRLRYSFRYEVEHLLAREGFRVERVYADYERHAYGTTYPGELIFVASRAASGPLG